MDSSDTGEMTLTGEMTPATSGSEELLNGGAINSPW